MKTKTIRWAGIALANFLLLPFVGLGQNPILRSTTTTIPTSISQITTSLLTQKSNYVGIGTITPTQRLTLTSYIARGEDNFETPASIRFEHNTGLGTYSYWHLTGGTRFSIVNPTGNIVPISLLPSGDVHFMNKVNLNVQALTTTYDNRLGLYVDNNVRRIFWTSYTTAGDNTTIPFEFLYDAQIFGGVDVTIMKLMPSGQVRIGNPNTLYQNFVLGSAANTNSSIRLTVDGNVAAKGFIATQQNWADFVFYAPEGNPTLEQEESSIEKNCTLVGVPTEAEAALGRNLADNDALLLQKLEQLYLHVIELNKKVETLTRENEMMKLRLEEK